MKTAVIRRATFNAAHKLWNKQWTDEKNESVFGLCANQNFHGHNYVLEVKVIGEIEEDTGYVIDLKILNDMIQENIIEKFDHKNLNLDVVEFYDLNPTAENIAVVTYNLLRSCLDYKLDLKIKLYETQNNFVEYPA
ncbi:MAG: 6-carboxytetrahydropterin synthase [Sphingobacteriales bacterium]|jgi:6-pyruvoyltetrahydropterin/6-carboxytetrahydropterin synthase|nr:MAG: 6-carboxytetrahydropterin synthase [Sphingobacteriales bacterium]